MEVGVFSSASTSLTPFFLLFLGFLSLSLFWSFWLFSLFLLSGLGTQFLLISWISLANSVPCDISLESSSLSTSTDTEAYKKVHGSKKRAPAGIRKAKVEVDKDELSKLMSQGTELAKEIQEIKRNWVHFLDPCAFL